jgi:hypothetical protein
MVLVVAPMATPTRVLHVGANQVGHGCFDGGREKKRLPVLRNARGGESSMNSDVAARGSARCRKL